ncbi:hypothetical protein KJ603_01270 [Patescibacteria group bacterium]|nr:hypothetical protein [Patescibacteria group bacterium]
MTNIKCSDAGKKAGVISGIKELNSLEEKRAAILLALIKHIKAGCSMKNEKNWKRFFEKIKECWSSENHLGVWKKLLTSHSFKKLDVCEQRLIHESSPFAGYFLISVGDTIEGSALRQNLLCFAEPTLVEEVNGHGHKHCNLNQLVFAVPEKFFEEAGLNVNLFI